MVRHVYDSPSMKTMCGGSHHQTDVATTKRHIIGYRTPRATNTLHTFKSTTTLHLQIHKILHSKYIGFVLLASMYIGQKQ